MNLSPQWESVFEKANWESAHWSQLGVPTAPDSEIFGYAKDKGFVVFTHDLDFGSLLFHTSASRPSVVQLRSENAHPLTMGKCVVAAIQQC